MRCDGAKLSFTVAFWLTDEIRHCDNFTDGWKDTLNDIGFSSCAHLKCFESQNAGFNAVQLDSSVLNVQVCASKYLNAQNV